MFFFFNDTATTEIYTLSLHDALPISRPARHPQPREGLPRRGVRVSADDFSQHVEVQRPGGRCVHAWRRPDRKSTRLNSSHANISYAVFCLKKKKTITEY